MMAHGTLLLEWGQQCKKDAGLLMRLTSNMAYLEIKLF